MAPAQYGRLIPDDCFGRLLRIQQLLLRSMQEAWDAQSDAESAAAPDFSLQLELLVPYLPVGHYDALMMRRARHLLATAPQ
jgi:hypothetical protein